VTVRARRGPFGRPAWTIAPGLALPCRLAQPWGAPVLEPDGYGAQSPLLLHLPPQSIVPQPLAHPPPPEMPGEWELFSPQAAGG